MDETDIISVRQTWDLVKPKKYHHGVEILVRLFEQYPEVQAVFPNLKDIEHGSLRTTRIVKAHAGRIMSSLTSIIDMLEDTDLLESTIYLLADTHIRHAVTNKQFQLFQEVTMEYLRDTLGTSFSPEADKAFVNLLTTFNQLMGKFLEA